MLSEEQLLEVVQVRHHLHQNPELGFQEHETAKFLKAFLNQECGIPETCFSVVADPGFVVDICGTGEQTHTAQCIAFRAEMDAVPMAEGNENLHYRSLSPDAAHMSGHDGHMATLVGFAWYLWTHRAQFPANCKVRLIFQPAEVGPGGAQAMISAGVLDGVDAIYAYHCTPHEEFCKVVCPDREVLAHVGEFTVTVKGRGGHGAYPHLNKDPIIAATQMINSLATVLARNISCHDKATLTVCSVHAGSAANVMPETCVFSGTIRDYSPEIYERVEGRLQQTVNGIAASMDVEAEVEFGASYPATVNHATNAQRLRQAAKRAMGDSCLVTRDPGSGSQDFSYFLMERPGAFCFIGTGFCNQNWHEPNFDFNDELIHDVMRIFLCLVEDTFEITFG